MTVTLVIKHSGQTVTTGTVIAFDARGEPKIEDFKLGPGYLLEHPVQVAEGSTATLTLHERKATKAELDALNALVVEKFQA